MKISAAMITVLFAVSATAASAQDDPNTRNSNRLFEEPERQSFDEPERQEGSDGFGDDRFGAALNPEPISVPPLAINVLQPKGEPAADALVILWNNTPIELTQLPDWGRPVARTMQFHGVSSALPPTVVHGVTNEEGSLAGGPAAVAPDRRSTVSLERGFLVWHSSGYATDATLPPPDDGTIRLRPFGSVEGTCTIDGVPLKDSTIVAIWQSFPLSPALMGISPEQMQHVPPIFQLRVAAATDESGKFRFERLPPGRIKFELHHGSPGPEIFEQPRSTNLQKWATISAAENEPLLLEFSARGVTGRLRLTDAIYKELTAVVARPGGGTSVGRKKAAVLLSRIHHSLDGVAALGYPRATFGNDIDSNSTLELVRAAAVWGRPGGRRERQETAIMAIVDDEGHFEFAAIEPGEYSASLMTQGDAGIQVGSSVGVAHNVWSQFRDDIFELKPTAFETSVAQAAGDDGLISINLGEIVFPDAPRQDAYEESSFDGVHDGGFAPARNIAGPSSLTNSEPVAVDSGAYAPFNDDSFAPEPTTQTGHRAGQDSLVPPTQDQGQRPLEPATLGLPGTVTTESHPVPPVDPLDQEIATLVARMIAAGDQSTKAQLLKPLQAALIKQFDAEQQSRESLIRELEARIQMAKARVQERSQNKAQFIRRKVAGLLSIADDTLFSVPRSETDTLADPETNVLPTPDFLPGPTSGPDTTPEPQLLPLPELPGPATE